MVTLQRLIDDKVPEDLSLEYKAKYESGEKGRFELAKDVAAIANASGGLIVIGVGESGNLPSGFSDSSRQMPTDETSSRP